MKGFTSPWLGWIEPQFQRAGHVFPRRSSLEVRKLDSTSNCFDLPHGSNPNSYIEPKLNTKQETHWKRLSESNGKRNAKERKQKKIPMERLQRVGIWGSLIVPYPQDTPKSDSVSPFRLSKWGDKHRKMCPRLLCLVHMFSYSSSLHPVIHPFIDSFHGGLMINSLKYSPIHPLTPLFTHTPIHLSTDLVIYWIIYLSIHPFTIYPPIHSSNYIPIHSTIHQLNHKFHPSFIYIPIYTSIHPHTHPTILHLHIHPSIHPLTRHPSTHPHIHYPLTSTFTHLSILPSSHQTIHLFIPLLINLLINSIHPSIHLPLKLLSNPPT